MALFKSADEKAEEQAKKERKLLKRYGVDELSDPRDMESVKKIAQELAGSSLQEASGRVTVEPSQANPSRFESGDTSLSSPLICSDESNIKPGRCRLAASRVFMCIVVRIRISSMLL